MRRHFLHRIYLPAATPGVLELVGGAGLELATLEDPLKGGGLVPNSCVPEGLYRLVRHSGKVHHDTWALVGEHVSHYPEPGKARSACVFHGGDTVADTLGCPLVGLETAYSPRLGVPVDLSGCVLALQALRAHLASDSEHELLILRG